MNLLTINQNDCVNKKFLSYKLNALNSNLFEKYKIPLDVVKRILNNLQLNKEEINKLCLEELALKYEYVNKYEFKGKLKNLKDNYQVIDSKEGKLLIKVINNYYNYYDLKSRAHYNNFLKREANLLFAYQELDNIKWCLFFKT